MYFVYKTWPKVVRRHTHSWAMARWPVWSGAWKEKDGKTGDKEMWGRDKRMDIRQKI